MVVVFVFPSNSYACWGPAFQEVAGHLPTDGKHWKNCFFCFGFLCSFCFSYLTVIILIHKPPCFPYILSPSCKRWEWARGKGGAGRDQPTTHFEWADSELAYMQTHTHLCMYKWIAVEFCLLNTGFAMVCHWYSMKQIISQIKKHRHENTFLSRGKKPIKMFTDLASLHEKSMTWKEYLFTLWLWGLDQHLLSS